MAFSTFTPPKTPIADGSQVDTNARVLEASFGDGYVQRVPDGINTIVTSTTLFWNGLSTADATTIDSFFAGLKGATPFLYQVPGDFVQRQWICKKWTRPLKDGVSMQMTADLIQDFSLS
jgi:phage-related protein